MASKRLRNGSWEYHVKRKNILPKELTFTFDNEAEGDAYVEKLEALLDRGIVPPELEKHRMYFKTIADVINNYISAVFVPESDQNLLTPLAEHKFNIANTDISSVSYDWAEKWITVMKQEHGLSPSTIRHYVGALARCFDWCTRKHNKIMTANPLRGLPRSYAKYNEDDAAAAELFGKSAKEDEERDRRPTQYEIENCRAILNKENPLQRQRPLEIQWQGALEAIFELAPETAMRLRELFTLEKDQVHLSSRTIFLDKTKNGDKRQVPLSTNAVAVLTRYIKQVKEAERGMAGFYFEDGQLFPWQCITPAEKRKTTAKLSRQFARIFESAGCSDLRFHDLRHEATCRFYEKTNLTDIQIAKITGHKDLRMLKRYANLRASDLAEKLW